MNWTGGRRARHNSNASLSTAARLQKQYFARVRMARDSRQSASSLLRSSSPIALAETISPPKPTDGRDGVINQGGRNGPCLEFGRVQENSRSVWVNRSSVDRQGRSENKRLEQKVQKKPGVKSRILGLELGMPLAVTKRPEIVKQKKEILLQEGDWLGTKNLIESTDDEAGQDHEGNRSKKSIGAPGLEDGNQEELDTGIGSDEDDEDGAILLADEDDEDDAILLEDEDVEEFPAVPENRNWQNPHYQPQQRVYHPSPSQDGNDSIFLEVGNVQFSTSRRKPTVTLVSKELPPIEEEDDNGSIFTSDSMLLNFEDGVLPPFIGDVQPEPAELPVVQEGTVEDHSNSGSYFTWSSSNYAGKGRDSPRQLPMGPDAEKSNLTAVHYPLLLSPGSSPYFQQNSDDINTVRSSPFLPLLPKPTIDDHQMNLDHTTALSSEGENQNSSVQAFASSAMKVEDCSDDGQWLEMILDGYYWDGASKESNADMHGHTYPVPDETLIKSILADMEMNPASAVEKTVEKETHSWRDIEPQCNEGVQYSNEKLEETAKGIDNSDSVEATEGGKEDVPKRTIKSKMEIDLNDDQAWRDFVYQPSSKEENWGEQNEDPIPLHGRAKRKQRDKFASVEESEDDYILPLLKRHQTEFVFPSGLKSADEASSDTDITTTDAQSNAATMGTYLSASEDEHSKKLSSVIGVVSSSSIEHTTVDGCSSVIANASSSPVQSRQAQSDDAETETAESSTLALPPPMTFTSALKNTNKSMRTETKKVMWGEDVKDSESGPKRPTTKRSQTESAMNTKSITGLKKVFAFTKEKGAREAVEEIEEW